MTLLDWLFGGNPWLGYVVSILLLLCAGEVGFYIGTVQRRRGHTATSGTTTLETAFLGLLALMIGFTFSIAVNRFDTRRAYLVDEANAMGTVALRSHMLPEVSGRDVRRLLHDYVQVRLNLIGEPRSEDIWRTDIAHASDLQQELWQHGLAASSDDPHSLPIALFVQGLNEMFDQQTKQIEAADNHVPAGVFALVYVIAMVSVGFNAYAAGLLGQGGRIPNTVAIALIATVIALVGDIDRPLGGLVTISSQPMVDVLTALNTNAR